MSSSSLCIFSMCFFQGLSFFLFHFSQSSHSKSFSCIRNSACSSQKVLLFPRPVLGVSEDTGVIFSCKCLGFSNTRFQLLRHASRSLSSKEMGFFLTLVRQWCGWVIFICLVRTTHQKECFPPLLFVFLAPCMSPLLYLLTLP